MDAMRQRPNGNNAGQSKGNGDGKIFNHIGLKKIILNPIYTICLCAYLYIIYLIIGEL